MSPGGAARHSSVTSGHCSNATSLLGDSDDDLPPSDLPVRLLPLPPLADLALAGLLSLWRGRRASPAAELSLLSPESAALPLSVLPRLILLLPPPRLNCVHMPASTTSSSARRTITASSDTTNDSCTLAVAASSSSTLYS